MAREHYGLAAPWLASKRPLRSIVSYSQDYELALALLRTARQRAGVTQAEVARRLNYQPSAVSKIERGELRMDIVQLRLYCEAIHLPLAEFVQQWDAALAAKLGPRLAPTVSRSPARIDAPNCGANDYL